MLNAAAFVFEVMDKEWPLWLVLAVFLGLGFIGMLLCRKWPMTVIVVLPLIVLAAIAHVRELTDPYVGEAIKHEAGVRYVVLSYSAIGSSVILLVVGAFQGWARRRQMVK
jgi:hypothetical protein